MLNEINTHQEPINGALLVPSSHGQAQGGPGKDANVQSRNAQKERAEFLPIFSSLFPCFQIAAPPPPAHGCAHARSVPAGEGSGTCCRAVMLLAVYPPLGDPFCPAILPPQASLSFPASQTQCMGGEFGANQLAAGGSYGQGLWGRDPRLEGKCSWSGGNMSRSRLSHGEVIGHSHASRAAHC